VSEERKQILQMVADGKISPNEADMLLQAIDDSERVAQDAAAENVRTASPSSNLGATIERAVRDGLRGLDQTLGHLETDLHNKLADQRLRSSIEDRIRRSTERAAERAREIEDRAARLTQREAERAARLTARMAERVAERAHRMAKRWEHREEHHGGTQFVKVGVAIDKETVERFESLQITAQPGDRLVIENRVGDITVEFHDESDLMLDVRKTVWGEDKADAAARADATRIELERRGADIEAMVARPSIAGAGVLILKDTRIDFAIKAPRGTHLIVQTKVGDIRIKDTTGMGDWTLGAQVGDVDIIATPGTGFRYTATSKLGDTLIDVPGHSQRNPDGTGQIGDGNATITATVKTGDIRIHTA